MINGILSVSGDGGGWVGSVPLVEVDSVSDTGPGSNEGSSWMAQRTCRWSSVAERFRASGGDNRPGRWRKAIGRFWYLSLLVFLFMIDGGELLRAIMKREVAALKVAAPAAAKKRSLTP